jgi:beta-lactamase regulating signal transducer with metallopeptidase domain
MMDAVFLKLLNMSLTAGWLILAVIALRLVLKKAPKWTRCALWGMVGLRLVLPFSVESALSLIPSAETISPNIGYASTPGITSGILALNQAVNPIISESLSPTAGASVNPLQIWTTVAGYVWLAGIAAIEPYTAISYIRLRRRVDTAVLLRDNIWQSENVKSPFILGLFQPLIYLPFNMTEENMTNVLAHENAHLKRRDHLIKPLAFLLLTVYWFNPLVWLAYVLLCRDIELACDERVVKVLDVQQRRDYGAALLSCSVSRKSIAACPLAFGEVGVKERIKTVLNYKKPAFWIIIAAVVACIVVALCFLTNPKDEKLYAPDPFGFGYSVESIIFESGTYGFSYTPETAPDYRVTDDSQFMVLEDKSSDSWLNAGTFEPVELTKDNFDRYFRGVKGPAAGLRRDNTKRGGCL